MHRRGHRLPQRARDVQVRAHQEERGTQVTQPVLPRWVQAQCAESGVRW